MSDAWNPYKASEAILPETTHPPAPVALKVAIGLYLLTYLLALLAVFMQKLVAPRWTIPAWLVVGAYAAGISFALWRRKRWARYWILVLTLVPVLSFVTFHPWQAETIPAAIAIARITLRIVVGCMMFLPSVQAWFALRSFE